MKRPLRIHASFAKCFAVFARAVSTGGNNWILGDNNNIGWGGFSKARVKTLVGITRRRNFVNL